MLGFILYSSKTVRKFNFVEFDAESADVVQRSCFQCFGWIRKIFFITQSWR